MRRLILLLLIFSFFWYSSMYRALKTLRKVLKMATVGDLLLLKTTYAEPSHRYPHQVHANLSPKDKELLDRLVIKLNRYSDDKVTLSSLVRLLVLFSIDSLSLRDLAGQGDPLCSLPDTSSARSKVNALAKVADIIDVDPDKLVHIEDVRKGSAIWK